MKTINGFRLRQLGNEYILVGETMELINFNKMITLNETAAFLWKQAEQQTQENGEFTTSVLTKSLCEEYDVPSQQAMTDVSSTIDEWIKAGVVLP